MRRRQCESISLRAISPRVADEMADVLICLLSLADRTGIDLADAVAAKLARNAEKYPAERVAGRMEKYDEYDDGEP